MAQNEQQTIVYEQQWIQCGSLSNKNNIKMNRDKDVTIGYQITVTNIITIGIKSMSDFYVNFTSPNSRKEWKSPVVHGKVNQQNTRYPWTFITDTHHLIVSFCQIDDKETATGSIIGSSPLLLMKKDGEEQFLIFGCKQSNKGRKVAEVEFTYAQCSMMQSSGVASSESNKRVSLEQTLEQQNYDEKKELNIIPQQSELEHFKSSITKNNQLLEQSITTEREVQNSINPSRLQTLKLETNRNKAYSEDSNIELNLLREIEDTTDRWYRSNFGKDMPAEIEPFDFQNNENSRVISVLYDKDYEYLNELSFTSAHMELRNVVVSSDKKPISVEVYGLDLDGSLLRKAKIVTMRINDGYKREWNNTVRLPKQKKAYCVEILTKDKERLQGLIIKEANYSKNSANLFSKDGKQVGKVSFSLKQVKKIQIQTLEIMTEQPFNQLSHVEINSLDKQIEINSEKSFISSPKAKTTTQVIIERLLISDEKDNSNRNMKGSSKNKLVNQIYLNQERQLQKQSVIETTPKRQIRIQIPQSDKRYISNQAYINQFANLPKKNFRKNQYEAIPIEQPQLPKPPASNSAQNKPRPEQISKITKNPQKEYTITNSSNKGFTSPMISDNEFLLEQPDEEEHSVTPNSVSNSGKRQSVQNLGKKIEQIKRMSNDLGKITKSIPYKKFNNVKYKTIVYNQDDKSEELSEKRSRSQSPTDSEAPHAKRTYREPINATPTFQSILSHQKSINQEVKREPQILQPQSNKANAGNKVKKQQKQQKLSIEKPEDKAISRDDQQQEFPIRRHQTTSQAEQIDNQNGIKYSLQIPSNTVQTHRNQGQKDRESNSYGVNTERMMLVNNILQSSYVPTTPTQKVLNSGKEDVTNKEEGWNGQQSFKNEFGSFLDSMLNEGSHKTKYSSQTIQPATQLTSNELNILINSISISYAEKEQSFSAKFVKIYIPNKHYYQTDKISNSNHLNWKCRGFLFSHAQEHQDLFVQLYSQGVDQKMLGRAIFTCDSFKIDKKKEHSAAKVIRGQLSLQSKVIGQVVLSYRESSKCSFPLQVNQQRHTLHESKTIQHDRSKEMQKETTPIRKQKRKKRAKSDSLTQFLKHNRKQKINRYIVNEYSRANIESRINPVRHKKYTAGKNIVIGRNVRFPFSPEEEHIMEVPGPGKYEQLSQFRRYQH